MAVRFTTDSPPTCVNASDSTTNFSAPTPGRIPSTTPPILQSPLEPQDNYNLRGGALEFVCLISVTALCSAACTRAARSVGDGFCQQILLATGRWRPIVEVASGRPFNIITGDDRNFDFSTPTDRPMIVRGGRRTAAATLLPPSKFSPTGFLMPACFLNGTLRRQPGPQCRHPAL